MTEEALLQACLKNQPAAQQELYSKYSPKMLAVCYRFARNREDAEDMLQEGFIRVFTQIHQFQNKGSFEGWIRRIIVHTCINHIKKHKKFNDSVDITQAHTLQVREDSVPSIIQAKQVIECIRMYSHREISTMLDIEESTSRSQYTRAKAMLEQILVQKKIIFRPQKQGEWVAAAHARF
jgi:RNA polymerase sigma-70 factor (ECF subfamily)